MVLKLTKSIMYCSARKTRPEQYEGTLSNGSDQTTSCLKGKENVAAGIYIHLLVVY